MFRSRHTHEKPALVPDPCSRNSGFGSSHYYVNNQVHEIEHFASPAMLWSIRARFHGKAGASPPQLRRCDATRGDRKKERGGKSESAPSWRHQQITLMRVFSAKQMLPGTPIPMKEEQREKRHITKNRNILLWLKNDQGRAAGSRRLWERGSFDVIPLLPDSCYNGFPRTSR